MPPHRSPRGIARGRAGAALLLAASLLCVAAPFAAASAPLVVAPAEIAVSTSVSVRVHGAASASGLRVVLADVSAPSSPVTVASAVAAAADGDAQTLVLDVPSSVDATAEKYEFRLFRASAADTSTPLASHDVKVFKSLASLSSSGVGGGTAGESSQSSATSDSQTNGANNALVLETDKPTYRPGQTVRARALALDALSLRPVKGTVTFVFRDPNSFVAMRVTADADVYGVASASLPTSKEPTLGDWFVEASFLETGEGDSISTPSRAISAAPASFALEKYVLPTFEVAVATESADVFRGVDTIKGFVSATYTHGARVAGTVDLSVWQKTFSFGGGGEYEEPPMVPMMFADEMAMADEPLPGGGGGGSSSSSSSSDATYRLVKRFPSVALDAESEDGVAFELDVSDASPGVDYGWGGWGGGGAPALVVEATARDASTGETQTGTASVTPRYRAFEVSIKGPSLFKPGTDAEMVLEAKTHDGAAVVGSFATKTTFHKTDGGSSTTTNAIELTAADQGLKRFYVRVPLNDAACCRVSDLTSWRSGSCCLSGASVELERDTASLRSVADGVAAGAGDVDDFAPYANWYGSMAVPVGVLDAFVTIAGAPYERVSVGSTIAATVDSSFDPPGGAFDWAVVAPGHGVLHSGSVTRGGTLSFTATEAMRRDATLVAYVAHDGAGGEATNVVACAKKVGVTFADDPENGFGLPETLALALDASEAAPGDAVRLTANSSAPGSRVFVLAHDVSVLIQSGGRRSAMSASKILAASAAAGGAGADAGTPFDSTAMAASWCWPAADIDETELVLLTAMKTSSCDPTERMMMFDGDVAMMDDGVPEMAFKSEAAETASADSGAESSSTSADSGSADSDSGGAAETRTRKFFPETWVWESFDVDAATGVGVLENLIAPDTITSWQFRAFATHPERGVAAADEDDAASKIAVTKPFFVRPNLPYGAVRGETLVVRVGVYNALSRDVTATIRMETAADCDDDDSTTPVGSPVVVAVAAGSFASATFSDFAPRLLGEVAVTFVATTELEGVSDAVTKTIVVAPEGFAVTKTVNAIARRSSDDGDFESYVLSVALPDTTQLVPDSVSSKVTVIGDTMGNSLGGLERLVRVPFGCGEQNMITLAPNVAAIKYLANVGRLKSDVQRRATDNVLTGYQRQLTYRHTDGSFSAFGESGNAPGSLWLTAFVLRVFADAKRVVALGAAADSIDDAVVAAAAAFVASKQNPDGSFVDPAPVLHAEMTGSSGAGLGLAAYCLLAMVEGGRSGANVDATIAYVSEKASNEGNAYAVAVAARALTRSCVFVNKGCDEAITVRAKMMTLGVSSDGGTTMRWGEDGDVEDGDAENASLYGFPHPVAVEATAYACLSLVESGDLANAYLAARWLVLRRNDLGGFRSTQDTVVGLEALAAYAQATFDDDSSLTVAVDPAGSEVSSEVSSRCGSAPGGGYAVSPVSVDRDTFDVMRVIDLTAFSSADVTVTGKGTAVVTLSVTYHLIDPEPGAYGVDVSARAVVDDVGTTRKKRRSLLRSVLASSVDASDADAIEMTACFTRPGDAKDGDVPGMLVARVGVFTGFAPTSVALENVVNDGGAYVRRADWLQETNEVVLYLEGTAFSSDDDALCVTFELVKRVAVSELKRATHKVQHYYRPDVKSEAVTASSALSVVLRSEIDARETTVTVGGVAATEYDRPVSGTTGRFRRDARFTLGVYGSACLGAASVLLIGFG